MPRGAGAAEHKIMRAEHAFSPAGKYAGDTFDQVILRFSEVRAQKRQQGLGKIATSEIIDAAIALGLADNGDDLVRLDGSLRDMAIQFREIARMFHTKSENTRPHKSPLKRLPSKR